MDTIHVKDFSSGDILLFKVDFSDPNTEWISKAIALLTKSDVSHAALYMGDSLLSDEGLSGLACHNISDDNTARPIYIRRLETPTDKSPILKSAEQYIKCDEPYDKPALLLLGLILLYRDYPIHLLPVKFVTSILSMVATKIDEYIAQIYYPGNKPMVCSQYVFQCYEDSGIAYQLQLNENCIANHYSLIEHVYEIVSNSPDEWNDLQNTFTTSTSYDEDFLSDSVEKLRTVDLSKESTSYSFEIDKDIIQNVLHLSNKLHTLLHKSNDNLSSIEKLRINMDSKALFVTPADLKLCTNLNDVGDAIIYRDSKNQEI